MWKPIVPAWGELSIRNIAYPFYASLISQRRDDKSSAGGPLVAGGNHLSRLVLTIGEPSVAPFATPIEPTTPRAPALFHEPSNPRLANGVPASITTNAAGAEGKRESGKEGRSSPRVFTSCINKWKLLTAVTLEFAAELRTSITHHPHIHTINAHVNTHIW